MLAARAADRNMALRALSVAEDFGLAPDGGLYYSVMYLAFAEGCTPAAQEVRGGGGTQRAPHCAICALAFGAVRIGSRLDMYRTSDDGESGYQHTCHLLGAVGQGTLSPVSSALATCAACSKRCRVILPALGAV
jgi:hypothetical protein